MNTAPTKTKSPIESEINAKKSIMTREDMDIELRQAISEVVCENPTDVSALNQILNRQDNMLTDHQRSWIIAVIDRNGMSLERYTKLFDET